jgi:SNF2 family DNA or RNA helicase
MICDDMGLGKTTSALATAARVASDFPTLIVCTPNCVTTWEEECRNFDGFHVHVWAQGKKLPTTFPQGKHPVVIVSYKALENPFKVWLKERTDGHRHARDTFFNRRLSVAAPKMTEQEFRAVYATSKEGPFPPETLHNADALFERVWGCAIFDEAQTVKGSSAKIGRVVCMLQSDYRIALTGTPILNKVKDIFNILRFALQYSECDGARSVTSELFCACKMGRSKEDVKDIVKIPQPLDVNVLCPMDRANFPVEYEWYLQRLRILQLDVNEMRNARDSDERKVATRKFFSTTAALRTVCWHRDLYIDKGVFVPAFPVEWTKQTHMHFPVWFRQRVETFFLCMRACFPFFSRVKDLMRLVCTVWAHQESTLVQPSPKLLATYNIYQDMIKRDPQDKLVVFSESRAYLERCVVPYFTQRGEQGVRLLCGGTIAYKQNTMKQFKLDPSVRVMCVVKSVGAVGLNLQDVSGTVVISEPHWNEATDAQCVSRILRHGQTRDPPRVYRLLVTNSVDTAMRRLQEAKRDMAEKALRGSQTVEVADTLSRLIDSNLNTALRPDDLERAHFQRANKYQGLSTVKDAKEEQEQEQENVEDVNHRKRLRDAQEEEQVVQDMREASDGLVEVLWRGKWIKME